MASVRKRKKQKLPIHIYLLYMILATLIFTGVTLSSYVSTSEGGDSATVALFANDTELTIPIQDCYPGCEFNITVNVRNYENGDVCEVSQAFEITAETVLDEIPLKLEWIGVEPRGNFYAIDGERDLQYNLKVSWPVNNGEYPSSDYADKIEVIRLIVDCYQVD